MSAGVRLPGFFNLHIVEHCNFNCAGCSHLSNTAPKIEHEVDGYIKAGENLAKYLHLSQVQILGGEPTLHTKFTEAIPSLYKTFKKVVDDVAITTNGWWLYDRETFKRVISVLPFLDHIICSGHPQLFAKAGREDVLHRLQVVKRVRPEVRVDLYERGEFMHTAFVETPIVNRPTCENKYCLQLDSNGFFRRCPAAAYAELLPNPPILFCEAERNERYDTATGNYTSFVEWVKREQPSCNYCTYGMSRFVHLKGDPRMIFTEIGV